MGLIFFFGDFLISGLIWTVSILSSIFTKYSKGLSMFLSIFFT